MAIESLRSRVLQSTSKNLQAAIQSILPDVLMPLQGATEELHIEILDSVRVHFPSLAAELQRVQINLEQAKTENALSHGQLHGPLISRAGAEIMAMLAGTFDAQVTAATSSVHEALLNKLQELIFVMGSSNLPTSPRPVSTGGSGRSTPRGGGSSAGLGLSVGRIALPTTPSAVPADPTTPGRKSAADVARMLQQMTPTTPAPMTPIPAPFVSPSPAAASAGPRVVASTTPTKVVKRVVRRRPKGPSSPIGDPYVEMGENPLVSTAISPRPTTTTTTTTPRGPSLSANLAEEYLDHL